MKTLMIPTDLDMEGASLYPATVRRVLAQVMLVYGCDPLGNRGLSFTATNAQFRAWENCAFVVQKIERELPCVESVPNRTMGGLDIKIDDSLPPDEIRIIDATGKVVARIFNLQIPQ